MQSSAKREAKGKTKKKDEIQEWLIEQISGILYLDPKQVDPRATFSSFGLSSRDAVMLSGDLEEWLERRLSPTLVYEYPTIDSLAEHLAHLEEPARGSATQGDRLQTTPSPNLAPARQFASELSALEVEKMSEEDAEAILLDKLNKINGTK